MAWAADYTQSSDLADMSSAGLHYQIIYAIGERWRIASGGGVWKLPVAGCLPFRVSTAAPPGSSWPPAEGADTDTFSIRWMQERVEAMAAIFHDNSYAGGYDGQASFTYFSAASLRTAAGLNSSGFTRHVPDGDGGYTTQYGLFQAGDYVCPHLWNELKACLKLMTTVHRAVAFSSQASRDSGDQARSTYALAKTAAETAFDAATEGTSVPPAAYAWMGEWSGSKHAQLARKIAKVTATLFSSEYDAEIDYYVMPKKSTNWYNNGDWADTDENKLQCFEQGKTYTAGGGTGVESTNYAGPSSTTTRPAWGSDGTSRGWTLDATPQAVFRYAGKLTYGDT